MNTQDAHMIDFWAEIRTILLMIVCKVITIGIAAHRISILFFVVMPDAFEKGAQKLCFLNLWKRDDLL